MVDYKVVIKTPEALQQALNQWKHNYVLQVETVFQWGRGNVFALVRRIDKKFFSTDKESSNEKTDRI